MEPAVGGALLPDHGAAPAVFRHHIHRPRPEAEAAAQERHRGAVRGKEKPGEIEGLRFDELPVRLHHQEPRNVHPAIGPPHRQLRITRHRGAGLEVEPAGAVQGGIAGSLQNRECPCRLAVLRSRDQVEAPHTGRRSRRLDPQSHLALKYLFANCRRGLPVLPGPDRLDLHLHRRTPLQSMVTQMALQLQPARPREIFRGDRNATPASDTIALNRPGAERRCRRGAKAMLETILAHTEMPAPIVGRMPADTVSSISRVLVRQILDMREMLEFYELHFSEAMAARSEDDLCGEFEDLDPRQLSLEL